jgi:hypothetical protein
MIQAKFGLNWPGGFRGEYFWKSLQTDDGRQVMELVTPDKQTNQVMGQGHLPLKLTTVLC